LLEIRFLKSNTDWNEFKSKVLNDIYIIMDYVNSGDDVANFVWSPDDNHVDHDWYFKEISSVIGSSISCIPSGTLEGGSSLPNLADSMDDGSNVKGFCTDWNLMGRNHEEFYNGFGSGSFVRSSKSYNADCDPHITKTTPDGGGSSTCTYWCASGSGGGVAWASVEKKLGRDIGMQCDIDNDYYQCYNYDCDLTDHTCIKCSGAIQTAGKTGVNKCEENCGADTRCDESSPNELGKCPSGYYCGSNCQCTAVPTTTTTTIPSSQGCKASDSSSDYPMGDDPLKPGFTTSPVEINPCWDTCEGLILNECYCPPSTDDYQRKPIKCSDYGPYCTCIDEACGIVEDTNGDARIDMIDIATVAKKFGSHGPDYPNQGDRASPNWKPSVDINGDGKIDMKDIANVAKKFGVACSRSTTQQTTRTEKLGLGNTNIVITITALVIVIVIIFVGFKFFARKR